MCYGKTYWGVITLNKFISEVAAASRLPSDDGIDRYTRFDEVTTSLTVIQSGTWPYIIRDVDDATDMSDSVALCINHR